MVIPENVPCGRFPSWSYILTSALFRSDGFFFIRIYFLRILRLKLPKFEEHVKNGSEARIFFRIDFLHVEDL